MVSVSSRMFFRSTKLPGLDGFVFFFWILNQCLNPKNPITPYILPFSKLPINVSISAKIRQKSAKNAFYKSFEVIWDRIISFKSEKNSHFFTIWKVHFDNFKMRGRVLKSLKSNFFIFASFSSDIKVSKISIGGCQSTKKKFCRGSPFIFEIYDVIKFHKF